MLVEIVAGALADASISYASARVKAFLAKRGAEKELAEICATAIEEAVRAAPALAEDFRSASFIKSIIVPTVQSIIEDPTMLPDPEGLSSKYIDMFVARFATEQSIDETLVRIFQTDRASLAPAFVAFFSTTRSAMYKSAYWQEVAHQSVVEQTFAQTGRILSILERASNADGRARIDLAAAAADAASGSAELREWPKDIFGQKIQRAALQRLIDHTKNTPLGVALLIGEAGSGKSALLAELTSSLEQEGTTVFAIKADTLPVDIQTVADIGVALGMEGVIDHEIAALAMDRKVVLIIDQLDAVSDVMDRSSARMRLLLRLVRIILDRRLPVHVVVSSRPFEAAHDARFQQLQAEEFKLELPTTEQVNELLGAVGIDQSQVDPSLTETLRRPFALKLFVELARRGVDLPGLMPSQLLDRWLETANLGSDAERSASVALMDRLAAEMIETETLWRPADRYEMDARAALTRCEAVGLVVRSAGKIGFSHQSWLDDFQAKAFRTGRDLSDYAWRNQGSLFVRAAVLRGLQRLRLYEPEAYVAAAESLLFDARTRRHLRHLVVDVFAVNPHPLDREAAWVESLIQSDAILARRALGKLVPFWENWRGSLGRILPRLMTIEGFQWSAVQALAAEAKADPDRVDSLIGVHWNDQEFDAASFAVLEQSGVITQKIEDRLNVILDRTKIDDYAISHLITTLRTDQRFAEACRLAYAWAMRIEGDRYHHARLHQIEELARAAPLEFSQSLLPWFISMAEREIEEPNPGRKRFRKSRSLSWHWNFNSEQDSPYEALRIALRLLAESEPAKAMALVEPLYQIEIDQIQELVAEVLIAGGAAASSSALQFLRDDERRFCIGDAHVQLQRGVSSTQMGLISQELVASLSAHRPQPELEDLRDRIENWTIYGPDAFGETDAELSRKRLQWADKHRMELLDRLPKGLLTPRRARQISDWRASNPRPVGKANVTMMADFVGSPMSEMAMAKASDDAIFNMLDELNDNSPERPSRRRFLEGGVVELSRAFAAFGKANPKRAIQIARERLHPGRHEQAAGTLVSGLSEVPEISAPDVISLIEELSGKGFESTSWRHNAAWALSKLCERLPGFPDPIITRLENWIECDPDKIALQIAQRLEFEERNSEQNKGKQDATATSILFGFGHGMHILPQDNFTILSAMASGLLSREKPEFDGWLGVLERHVAMPEDPDIWKALLAWRGSSLFWADRARVQTLLGAVWRKFPEAFDTAEIVGFLWSTRAMFPDDVIGGIALRWLANADPILVQAGAEFLTAANIVDRQNVLFADLAGKLDDKVPAMLLGKLFAAAAAWREDDMVIRPRGHAVLMQFAKDAQGDLAQAISTAVDHTRRLLADDLTVELVKVVSENPALLGESLNGRFADGLQGLLLYPGFDELVLSTTEKIVELKLAEPRSGMSFLDQDFVHVTVALQRSDGPVRERAMDLYEKLLDANVYGAEEAAKAAMGR